MVEHCAYLFLGEDEATKKKKLNSIKEQYLDKGLKGIDFETIYADNKELTPPKFNEVLSYFPSNLSKKRIVLIRNIETLSKENKDILIRYLKSPSKYIILVFDSGKIDKDDLFLKELEPLVNKFYFATEAKDGVFDLTQAIVQRKTTNALKILNSLLDKREKSYNILGALFWQWDNMKDKLSLDKFKQGLKLLLDTDIKIKTGKLKEELALEMVVIRLSYLI